MQQEETSTQFAAAFSFSYYSYPKLVKAPPNSDKKHPKISISLKNLNPSLSLCLSLSLSETQLERQNLQQFGK
jgi:hypothetical protein